MSERQNEHNSASLSLLRDQLLPNLLREDLDDILYWAGKELARENRVKTEEEIAEFFSRHQFGELELVELKKNHREYRLSGEVISFRLAQKQTASFSLETGFLAEQLQLVTETYAEGTYEVKKRKNEVVLIIKHDPKEDLFD